MNKQRVEAFSDAVVAIIITIMVLEFKTPTTSSINGILEQWPYLLAYAVSFYSIAVAWYNVHLMFTYLKKITKKIYWANMIWLFTMSFLPIATAWAGKFIDQRTPEYFYFFINTIWFFAYYALSIFIRQDVLKNSPEYKEKIRTLKVFSRYDNVWVLLAGIVIMVVLIYVFPPIALVSNLFIFIAQVAFTKDDEVFGEY